MRTTTLRDYKKRMLQVLVYIQENLDAELALDRLAEVAHFSPYHFHRIFRGMLGESVKQHVRRLRLERAAIRLKQSKQPVTMIAFDAGFETHEGFTRAFKAHFGEAPSAFRKRRSAVEVPPALSGVHYSGEHERARFTFTITGGTKMEVRIVTMEPMRVAFVRHVGPYAECGAAWDVILPRLGSEGLLGPQTRFIGMCHDDPEVTPPEHVRYDACASVSEDFAPEGDIGVQTISGGEYAVTTHKGPYERFGETYAAFFGRWLPRSGRELRSSPCLEIYLNDPESTDPQDLLTDICAPLAPKR